MASDSTRSIAIAALVLSGGAIGVLVGRWTLEPPIPFPSQASPPALPDLAPLVEEIRRANESVLEAVSHRESSEPAMSAREVAVPNSDALNRLATTLERTNELLANSERDGLLRNLNSSRWKSEGYLSMDALTEMMERERAAGDGWPQKTQDELRQRHAGWTREDLFGRYGAPTSVEAGERGLTVLYGSTSFFIAEGLVISGRYK